jgi:hypothetical protein
MNPKRYGERLEVNMAAAISINDALSEARARVVQMPTSPVMDAEVVEPPTIAGPPAPDIFS